MRTATGDLDLVRVYLDQIGRHPLLTKEDEIELSQACPSGRVAQLKDTAQAVTSLDAPVGDDGAALGFIRERARQLERAALSALRRPETRARLEDLHVH